MKIGRFLQSSSHTRTTSSQAVEPNYNYSVEQANMAALNPQNRSAREQNEPLEYIAQSGTHG